MNFDVYSRGGEGMGKINEGGTHSYTALFFLYLTLYFSGFIPI